MEILLIELSLVDGTALERELAGGWGHSWLHRGDPVLAGPVQELVLVGSLHEGGGVSPDVLLILMGFFWLNLVRDEVLLICRGSIKGIVSLFSGSKFDGSSFCGFISL
jgi:hypothetical protein